MRLIVTSKEDVASANIFDRVLDTIVWKEGGRFDGNPWFSSGNLALVTIDKYHLYTDQIDRTVHEELGFEPELVIFASKHRSESGLSTLTVHPIGNFGKAEFGGKSGELVPSCPSLMTNALRILKAKAREASLEYKVSFEATHHGPWLETPSFYIEIGSLEEQWKDERAAEPIAQTIIEADISEYPIAVGVGGGHYCPRITDVALARRISFGHIIPSYALEKADERILRMVIEGTPEASLVYFHRKEMKKSEYRRLKEWFEANGLRPVREDDLEVL
jgi:D-aminoacyl-tRNA deacylase